MRISARQPVRCIPLLLACCALLVSLGPVVAAATDGNPATTSPADSTTTASAEQDERPWLVRTLNRYFGGSGGNLDGLQGRAVETSSQYDRYAGLPIEVVIVHPVLRFGTIREGGRSTANRLLNDLAKPLQSYTRDGVIRSYLLFAPGDRLDPFALADTERLLRRLEYIADVRILVVKLTGPGTDAQETVAVIVEPMDRWPLGINGKIKTKDIYSLKFYSVNVLGTGSLWENEVLVNRDDSPEVGYRCRLRKENLAGTFIAVEAAFEDSYAQLRRGVRLERRLAHPGVDAIGGVGWERLDDRENDGKPRKYDQTDAWLGYAVRLFDPRDEQDRGRPMLVPAVSYQRRGYLARPAVSPDTNRSYHDRSLLLAGVSLQRFKYYKTSYLFGDGETEDLPSGILVKLSGGCERGEFERRTAAFFESTWSSLRNRGDVATAGLAFGGYLHDRRLEDGVLDVRGSYYTPLLGGGRYFWRLTGRLRYTLGIGRHRFDRIYLDDEAGVRGLGSEAVAGNQRLVANLQSRLYTPWSVLGFRFSCFGFADLGLIGDEEAASLFQEKLYASVGVGARLRNPDLVLPTLQLRIGLLSNVDEVGMTLQVKVGNAPYPTLQMASARPGTVDYR